MKDTPKIVSGLVVKYFDFPSSFLPGGKDVGFEIDSRKKFRFYSPQNFFNII